MGWEIRPDGLRTLARRLHREYGVQNIHLSENGLAQDDPVLPDGSIDDHQRIAFLRAHVEAVAAALAEGLPLRGYFVWSLLDNVEWSLGLSQRFGLYHVDWTTLERRPKASAVWYRRLIASRGRDR
jgi:beta-glucosidase